jgi:hypothetical protein
MTPDIYEFGHAAGKFLNFGVMASVNNIAMQSKFMQVNFIRAFRNMKALSNGL